MVTLPFPSAGSPTSPFSELVAEASMQLPPLTRPQDMAFLDRMTEVTIDAFWQNYVAALPEDVQEEFHRVAIQAVEEEEGEALGAWFEQHANFDGDPEAQRIASEVMADLRIKLPGVFQKEYPLFTEDDAVAA